MPHTPEHTVPWTDLQLEMIAAIQEETGLSEELAKLKVVPARPAGPAPTTPPIKRTPAQRAGDILRAALESLGVPELSDKEFAGFQREILAEWGLADATGEFKDGWPAYVQMLSQRPVEVPQTLPGELEGKPEITVRPSPIEVELETWRDAQTKAKEAAGRPAEEARAKALATKTQTLRDKVVDGQFKDALAEAKLQHPGSKQVIEAMKEELQAAWEAQNQQQRDEFASLPPEIQDIVTPPSNVPIDTFVHGIDLGRFAEQNNLGDLWQQGEFKGTLESQVFEPLRKAAKTPAEMARAEAVIKRLKASPALLGQFQVARQDNPGLTASDWLNGNQGSQVIRDVLDPALTPQEQAKLQASAMRLAARGLDSLQIAQALHLGSGQTAADGGPGSDREMAFVRNLGLDAPGGIREQAIQGRLGPPKTLPDGTTVYANPNYDPTAPAGTQNSLQYVPATPTGGPFFTPEGQAVVGPGGIPRIVDQGGGLTPAGYPGGFGWAYATPAQRQARQAQIREAAMAYLERGHDVASLPQALRLTGDDLAAFYKMQDAGEFTNFEAVRNLGMQERTKAAQLYDQSTTAGGLAAWAANNGLMSSARAQSYMNAARSDATGVLEQVRGEITRATEARGQQTAKAGALEASLSGLQADATGGALEWLEQFQRATPNSSSPYYPLVEASKSLFGQLGGREYLSSRLQAMHAEYAQETAARQRLLQNPQSRDIVTPEGMETIYLQPNGTWGSNLVTSPLPAFREYIQPYLPRIAGEFTQFQKKEAAARQRELVRPAEVDVDFAPTLTSLLTNYAARTPGVAREDLLSQNADIIKNTYAEFLKRKRGQAELGGLSAGQQRQMISSGIL